jgi:endonuclease/exonuclease/phosphatase family metal-dependent hydrolase
MTPQCAPILPGARFRRSLSAASRALSRARGAVICQDDLCRQARLNPKTRMEDRPICKQLRSEPEESRHQMVSLKQRPRWGIQLVVGRSTFFLVLSFVPALGAGDLIRYQAPKTLSFEDLVTLASVDPPPAEVQTRLDGLLSEPFLSNEASLDGATEPAASEGRPLRIAEWNINREDTEAMMLAFSDLKGYQALAERNSHLGPKALQAALEQAKHLEGADVIVLNEVDHGMNRTGYHDVTRDIAKRLRMNYVFATEFVELTPLYLGSNKMDAPDLVRQEQAAEQLGVDRRRYLGLEGSALLSRYPIRSARIVHLPEAYDWYHGEIQAISDLGKVQNWTAKKLFAERVKRQVRRGGRIMIVAELEIPGQASGVITMVCPHLEDYSNSKRRRQQMDFALAQIQNVSSPVVMAGDLNTMGHNAAPLTAQGELKDHLLSYRFWMRQVIYNFTPVPGANYAIGLLNHLREFHDPTVSNIPVLASSHERFLFDDIHRFRFADGARFAWHPDKHDSFHHRGGTLDATNQRAWKGFQPTFEFAKNYHGFIGTYKLDWIFVKEPAFVQPSQARTLRALNVAPEERISDHSPITVDLLMPTSTAIYSAAEGR